ncbi:MAG: TetR/AcrR family transcriptional regulator [Pseudomonadota bacterium]
MSTLSKLFQRSPQCNPQCSPGAQQVLDAARVLFSELGVDAVSMQDIATKAKVSKANVFHHFANKEALYIAVLRACVNYDQVGIASLIESPAPFEQRFLALMEGQLKDMLDDPGSTRLVIREVTNGNVERAKLIATQIFAHKIRERIAFFEDAKQRGELRPGVDPHLCDMLLGACCMFHFNCGETSKHISEELGTGAPLTPKAFALAMSQLLTQGMCPAKAAAPKPKRSSRPTATAPRKPPRRKQGT